jgi:bacteriocin-like protein
VPLSRVNHGEEFLRGHQETAMRELSTKELDTVIGGTEFLSPGVYLEEVSVKMTSIPGVSTSTGQQTYVAYQAKTPFHWH